MTDYADLPPCARPGCGHDYDEHAIDGLGASDAPFGCEAFVPSPPDGDEQPCACPSYQPPEAEQ